MAYVFNQLKSSKLRAKKATSTDYVTLDGITATDMSPVALVEQVNKLTAIFDAEIAADKYMTRTITQEVIEDE